MEFEIILAEDRKPIPGSGPCQLTGIFLFGDTPGVKTFSSSKQLLWSNNKSFAN